MNVDFLAGFVWATVCWGALNLGRRTYQRIKAWRIARETEVADLRTRVLAFNYAMDRYEKAQRELRDTLARSTTKEC